MKKVALFAVLIVVGILSGCQRDAEVASYNLSYKADQFQILRKISFYNNFTGEWIYSMEGFCSIEVDRADDQLEVTCKVGDGKYLKHFLGLNQTTTYTVVQLEPKNVSTYHFKLLVKPQAVLPSVEVDMSTGALLQALPKMKK